MHEVIPQREESLFVKKVSLSETLCAVIVASYYKDGFVTTLFVRAIEQSKVYLT